MKVANVAFGASLNYETKDVNYNTAFPGSDSNFSSAFTSPVSGTVTTPVAVRAPENAFGSTTSTSSTSTAPSPAPTPPSTRPYIWKYQ